MKISRISLLFFTTTFFFFSAVKSIEACSCVISPPVNVAFEKSANVVILKLRAVEKKSRNKEEKEAFGNIVSSKLTVEKVFKGNLKSGQELVFHQGGGADCIWTFGEKQIGEEFLFYLGEKPLKGDFWVAFTCSRSGLIKYSNADLLFLEKFREVQGKSRLSGNLTQIISSSIEEEDGFYKALSEKTVRISGMGKDISLKTNEHGVYEIYDLPPGKYKVSAEKIEGYSFNSDKENFFEVEIKKNLHTEQNFRYGIFNSISGKFLDANNQPLEEVSLDLIPVHGKKSRYFLSFANTDKKGNFSFASIPAGIYLIVVNDDGEISAREPFKTFYYPNVFKKENAVRITVGAGDIIQNLIITAPETEEVITVRGQVLFEKGKVKSADGYRHTWVEFVADNAVKGIDEEKNSSRAEIDEEGRFTIRILKGQKGKLSATKLAFIGEYKNCPKLDKLIKLKNNTIGELKTNIISLTANNDFNGMELKFPFPSCELEANID